ncbi:MAG: HDOD domain-containing protein [Xylophilus ampelinus]
MTLDDLLAHPTALPNIPRVVTQLLAELDKDEPDLRRINQLIGQDPALTIRLLRLANAAIFGRAAKVASISEALALLGLGHVRSLALVATLACAFGTTPGLDMLQFWRCSLDVAKMSRALAGMVGQPGATAFTAGLVHAVGEMVMHAGMPHTMRALDDAVGVFDVQRAALESRELGYTFAEVGAGFARSWHFPPDLSAAILDQNDPLGNAQCEPLAAVLHLAGWMVRAQEAGFDDAMRATTFPDVVGLALGLDAEAVQACAPAEWTRSSEAALFF